jgi:Tfp pilus assembly protein PilX
MKRKLTSSDSNRGIALIVTLGFLAIIFLLAVAFATSMRVERLTARNYKDGVAARHLAEAALTRAMDSLDVEMTISGMSMYPSQAVYVSSNGYELVSGRFMDAGEGTNYLPDAVINAAITAETTVEWDLVEETGAQTGNMLRGRVSWMAVDCSGLIDANTAGQVTRGIGSEIGEVAIGNGILSALDIDEAQRGSFVNQLTNSWVRFETVPELWQLVPADMWNTAYVNHTFIHSDFPEGYWGGTAVAFPVDINSFATNLPALEAQLIAIGFTDPETLAKNIRDYVDLDNVPNNGGGVDSFCTEAVPMLSELRFKTKIRVRGSNYFHRVDVTVELWYPFGNSNTNEYDVELQFQAYGSPQRPFNPSLNPAETMTPRNPIVAPSWDEGDIRLFDRRITATYADTGDGPPTVPTTARVALRVRERSTGDLVDGIENITFDWSKINPDAGNKAVPASPAGWGKEVEDPRINWNWDDHWAEGHSPGNTNGNTQASLGGAGKDDAAVMFVRNGPLETVGELGFLLYDDSKPWTSIRLIGGSSYDTSTIQILNAFTVNPSAPEKGYVNLNSTNPVAVAAALVNAPLERYPGELNAPRFNNEVEALTVARELINSGPFTNLSDLAFVDESALEAASALLRDGIDAEALIRNSTGLFRTRQNLFTIFVAAQTLAAATDEVTAERRAVAVVWRDPYAAAPGGRHEMYVRYFKWLDN